MHRLRLLAAAFVAAVALTACGGDAAPGRSTAPEPGRAGKANRAVGTIAARVLERPSADRAVVEADWALASGATACELELVLPEGALLVEGEPVVALPDEGSGSTTWLVEFPTGRELDAVIRLCAHTPAGHRATEAYVRLVGGT